ncbi:MAG: 16S rRNA (cytosine(1402)-N(4))-methyltransferase RsmH [Tannerella sp.]|jgi:16S rRNA (cytosine1402-N4)-methyltransferase|nr:16S rRNA (cytosine(1402)-N(4))-methyltransferase RsmH [Tannerella sp.]
MSETDIVYHVPVMLHECLDALNINPDGVYVDLTFGGGGHSRAILERLSAKGKLYGFDQDADAEQNIPAGDGRFTFVRSNFRYLQNFMRYHGEQSVDGILADLGVSWHHFDDEKRGFSFRFDSKLDMRMNNRAGRTAAEVLNEYTEEQLSQTLYLYGELKQARRIAAAIVQQRASRPLLTATGLIELLSPFVGRENDRKFFAKAFQALRIEVNQEMSALSAMMQQTPQLLRQGGRLAIITYHSLEDRLVKNFIKTGNMEGQVERDIYGIIPASLRVIDKIIIPSDGEIARNPRSRSAKLRVAEKR